MKKLASILALSTIGLAGTAIAQTATYIEIGSDEQVIAEYDLTVDQIEDMNVYDANGDEIGEVEEVLGSDDGTPTALAVEVGGFLDIGDTDAIVTLDQATHTDDRLQIDMTREEIEGLPTWND